MQNLIPLKRARGRPMESRRRLRSFLKLAPQTQSFLLAELRDMPFVDGSLCFALIRL